MNVPFDPLDHKATYDTFTARKQAVENAKEILSKTEFESDGVAPFIGRFGYPHVNVGILAPPTHSNDSWNYDAPKYWAFKEYQIPEIVGFRSSLLNSRAKSDIRSTNNLIELAQDVALASDTVDVNIRLKKVPSFNMSFDTRAAPTGPQASLEKAKLTVNPKIHTKAYRVFSDTDLKANEALTYLYDNKFDENYLSKVLSSAAVGLKNNRKLVPTRWSITATDDTLGKHLMDKIQDFNEANHTAFFGGYLGNYYLILFFPDVWGYELVETYVPGEHHVNEELRFKTDVEFHQGRKDYANNTAGGYYTVKLAILEKLQSMKRIASVLALRFITPEYTTPLGVWVTRQAARKALESPVEFSSKELLMDYAKKIILKRFNWNIDYFIKQSVLLKHMKTQKKLSTFF